MGQKEPEFTGTSMGSITVYKPADGSRIVQYGEETLLFGQPPEVLKGLLLNEIPNFNSLVLTDINEKDGSLLHNIEFPLYFFLFMSNGLAEGKKLNLIGDSDDISRVFRLLRLTLLGPTSKELDQWGTASGLKREWLQASEYLAL